MFRLDALRTKKRPYTIRCVPPIYLPRLLLVLLSIESVFFHFSGSAVAQSNGAAPAKIGAMTVEGANRISADRVIAATGLKSGQPFDPQQLNAVMEKLGKSGVFADLSYSFLPQGAVVKIDFKVEEAKFRNCLFDNFVWLSKEEIDSGLQKELPLYVDVAPETGDLLDEIATALEKLSQEKGIKVHVTRRVQQQSIDDKNWSHSYVAEGAKVKVESVRFDGSLTVNANELQKAASLLAGRDYSAFETGLFGSATIAPFFADRGYLRVQVGSAVIKVAHAEGTQDFSVEITYPVTEGPPYHWQAAEWSGDQTIPPKDLDALTGMKPNDVANAKRIADGWEAVKEAYARQGYIDAKLSTDPVLDDTNRRVHYRVKITAGPQYRMGSFLIIGLPPKLEESLKERWKLKAGNVFDSAYAKDFVKKEFIPALQSGGVRAGKISFQAKPNHDSHVVDFTLKVE